MPTTSIIYDKDGHKSIHLGQLKEGPYVVYEWRQTKRPRHPEACLAGSGYENKSVPIVYSLSLIGEDKHSWYYLQTLVSEPSVEIVDVTDRVYHISLLPDSSR